MLQSDAHPSPPRGSSFEATQQQGEQGRDTGRTQPSDPRAAPTCPKQHFGTPRAEATTAEPEEGWGHAGVTPGAAGTVPMTPAAGS